MPRKGWFFPHPRDKCVPVPKDKQEAIRQRIVAYIAEKYPGTHERIEVRFRGKYCYVDAYTPPPSITDGGLKSSGETRKEFEARWRSSPTHLCRLLHHSTEEWGCAFYTYSNERYEVCAMSSGKFTGPLEEGLDIGATYLQHQ